MAGVHAAPVASLTAECGHAELTRRLGEGCGRNIRAPLVVLLIGDLGSGKTVFVQGLARGLEVPERYYITSPSFTLINEYHGRLPLFHIDLYRLESNLNPDELGLTEILRGDGVAAVEWADRIPPGFLSDRLEVHFQFGEGNHRTLRFFAYGQEASRLLSDVALITNGRWPTHDQD